MQVCTGMLLVLHCHYVPLMWDIEIFIQHELLSFELGFVS